MMRLIAGIFVMGADKVGITPIVQGLAHGTVKIVENATRNVIGN